MVRTANRLRNIYLLILLFPVLLFWFSLGYSNQQQQHISNPVGLDNLKTLTATASRDSSRTSRGIVHHLKLNYGVDEKGRAGSLSGSVRLFISAEQGPSYWGQQLIVQNPGRLDSYMHSIEAQIIDVKQNSIVSFRNQIIQPLSRRLTDQDPSGLLSALLLGKPDNLAVVYRDLFRQCGASHLLALSGFHLGLLLGTLALCAGKRRSRLYIKIILICCAWVYHLVVGPVASLTRAAITISVLLLFPGKKNIWMFIRSLVAGTVLVLIFRPSLVSHIGFRLSFFALAGILLLSPICKLALASILPRFLGSPLGVSCAAQLGTMGISVLAFEMISLWSIIYILFLTPLISFYALCGLFSAVFPVPIFLLDIVRRVIVFILHLGRYNPFLYPDANLARIIAGGTGVLWLLCIFRTMRFRHGNKL